MSAIDDKYTELGGTTSFLGHPEHEERACSDSVGRYRQFKHGSIHWHPDTGAHETHGTIRDKWAVMGFERSALGYPTSDEQGVTEAHIAELLRGGGDPERAAHSVNRCSHFQHGRIFCWSPDTHRYFTTVITTDGVRTDEEHRRHHKHETARRIASIVCTNCKKKVHAYRAWAGRILVTTSAGLALAAVGGVIGASIGLATGGFGAPATIPLAAIGLVVGAGLGYIISDKTLDLPTCPKCKHPINLGF
jgi:LGFP repeat